LDSVNGFQGEYRFLSNFYPVTITFEGLTYESSEAAYQANKSEDENIRKEFTGINARDARNKGRQIVIRQDWEAEKLNVMYKILRAKFTQSNRMRTALIDTKDLQLIETNYWYDEFWGVYNGKGLNHLGRLLMIVRDEIKEGII